MNIAIDISPLETGHKTRGIGFYLQHLKDSLVTYYPQHTYSFFTKKTQIPRNTDIVHYPYFDPFFLTYPFKKDYKTVVTIHDLTPLVFPKHFPSGKKGRVIWEVQKRLIKNADVIVTDSEVSKNDINRIIGIPKEKIHAVYLSASEEFSILKDGGWKDEIQKKYDLPEKYVLYVGDVTWNKNLPRLIESIKKTDIPLVMVGKSLVQTDYDATNIWNKDLVTVQEMTQNDKQIIKLGFVPTDDLVMLYNRASVFVMPSLYEGFGLPILEAMSCGCPVITSKEGSLPEVAGDAAYYVNAYDVIDISEGIIKVFTDRKLQKKLSESGLTQAGKFTWKKTAGQTIKSYES